MGQQSCIPLPGKKEQEMNPQYLKILIICDSNKDYHDIFFHSRFSRQVSIDRLGFKYNNEVELENDDENQN